MNIIFILDFIGIIGFGTAFLVALFIRHDRIDRISKLFLCLSLGIYFFIKVANTIQYEAFSNYFNQVEDYFEVMFLPFFLFFIFSYYTWLEMRKRTNTERALKKSEEQYRSLVENIDLGVTLIDKDHNIIVINSAQGRMFGKSVTEFPGKKCFREFEKHDDVCPHCPGTRAMASRQPQEVETEGVRDDGSKIQVRIRAFPVIGEDGEPSGFIEVVEDVTERKRAHAEIMESEAKFRTLFELSPQAVAVMDLSTGVLLDVNNKLCELTRYRCDEIIGRTGRELGFYTTEKRRKLFEALQKSGEIRGLEMSFRAKDGSMLDTQIFSRLIELQGETVVFTVFHDITKQKKMEKELQKIEKLESIGVLAGGIAHDFNNLLTGVLGNISLAKMYASPGDKVFDKLVETEKASLRAKELTMQLLTFAKGGAPVTRSESIEKLFEESFSFSLCGANVKCEFDFDKDLWPVEVDGGQIGQVFQNLALNAKQAMPEGGSISVRAGNVVLKERDRDNVPLPAGKYVLLTITDQGAGIPQRHLDKIFDPYFTTKQAGSGLGLAMCYSIIDKHKGLIKVESTLGKGTTFFVYLPASEKSPQDENQAENLLTGSGKILVVDDEDLVREVAVEMLKHLGYEAESAVDGRECLELYDKARQEGRPYDAVLMDLTIPGGMGGRESVAKLLAADPEAKVIVSSGYSNDSVMANYKEFGFVGVIVKPYKIEELGETLHKTIK